NQTQNDAQFAEEDERPAPAEMLADNSGKISARNRPHVNARLVDAERPRARPRAVVIADHRYGGGIIESLAQPLGRSKEQQLAKAPRKSSDHADAAPDMQPAEDGGLAPDSINEHSRKWRPETVHPGERRAEQALLHLAQA